MLSFLKRLPRIFKKPSPDEQAAIQLLSSIHAQARQKWIYSDLGVTDSVEGRLESLLLHIFIVLTPLKHINPALSQNLIEQFFSQMDAELREMGVSDMKIAKKIKAIGSSLYGRINAYESACLSPELLSQAIARNFPFNGIIYENDKVFEYKNIAAFAKYTLQAIDLIGKQSYETFYSGEIIFPPMELVYEK